MYQCFSTEILEFNVPIDDQDFHQEIIDYALADSNSNNKNYSLTGGTAKHGEPNLANLDYSWSIRLKSFLETVSSQYFENITSQRLDLSRIELESWYVVLGSNDMSLSHVHPRADIAGCYYLTVPENFLDNQGSLVFIDPRPAARYSRLSGGKQMIIKPRSGLGLIFPGWLEHYVIPHSSLDYRISIAWNVNFIDL